MDQHVKETRHVSLVALKGSYRVKGHSSQSCSEDKLQNHQGGNPRTHQRQNADAEPELQGSTQPALGTTPRMLALLTAPFIPTNSHIKRVACW